MAKKRKPAAKCFECNGTGLICKACGETEINCDCEPDVQNVGECATCKGTGK